MKTLRILAAAAAAMALTAGAAQAGTVTFDDAAGNAVLNGGLSPFSDGGLTFTASPSSYMYVYDPSSPNSNGTNNLIFAGFNSSDAMTLTKSGGGAFSLYHVDLAISWYDENSPETITINGTPLTITDTLATYNLNLLDVTSVVFSGVASNSGYWLMDNVATNVGAVPEPMTLALLGTGTLGLAAARRRRHRPA